MDELDKLKSDWKKSGNKYPTFSENDIYAMVHKKSSSIVKWILIISMLEFLFWGLMAVVNSVVGTDYHAPAFIEVFDYINYAVLIVFIGMFYVNYRNISAERPVKDLLKNIINIRRIVKLYMLYNLCIISFSLIFGIIMWENEHGDEVNKTATIAIGVLFIIAFVIVIYLIYKLLYGRLINKLNDNYIELLKIKEL